MEILQVSPSTMTGPTTSPIADIALAEQRLGDQEWRLNNLYRIIDRHGKEVPFRMNAAQRNLWENLWYLNIILKSRQHGFTTFICILFLDACLWNSNIRAGIIAHNKDEAHRFFRDKIKFAYDRLPEEIKALRPARRDATNELLWDHNSSIYVSTSMRSGTLQYLHISEFGKICAQYPHKAREIVTGSLETVAPGQYIFIESTAEGATGYFHDYCKAAQDLRRMKRTLTTLDFRFNWHPWFKSPYNVLDPAGVVINERNREYFQKIEGKTRFKLSPEQKAWYVKKKEILGDDIKREHPSTPEEAFEASIEGAYFATQMAKIREDGRICRVPIQEGMLVDTWWDIGMSDYQAIWFTQDVGREVHVIDYYENCGEGIPHYAGVLKDKKYRYGRHVGPHDLAVREWSSAETRKKIARDAGINFDVVPRVPVKMDSIEAARKFLAVCVFDEERCSQGITRLDNYRKEWNDNIGAYRKTPLEDENCHGADALQTLAMGHKFRRQTQSRDVENVDSQAWT